MRTSKNITVNYHKSLDTLKILTFWQIIKDKNVLLLDKDYHENKTYSKKNSTELQETWLNLYDEYYTLLDDSKARFKMGKSFDELKLRDKINQVKYNYDFLIKLKGFYGTIPDEDIHSREQETYARLKLIDKRIKPLYFKGIDINLKNLDKVMKSLINKYNTDYKTNQKEVEKQVSNVYDIVASAESWLERNIPIGKMVVSHWIAIEKQVKQKQKASQKNGK